MQSPWRVFCTSLPCVKVLNSLDLSKSCTICTSSAQTASPDPKVEKELLYLVYSCDQRTGRLGIWWYFNVMCILHEVCLCLCEGSNLFSDLLYETASAWFSLNITLMTNTTAALLAHTVGTWRLITCHVFGPIIKACFSCVLVSVCVCVRVSCPAPLMKTGSLLLWTISLSWLWGKKKKETGSNYLEKWGLCSWLIYLNRISISASH